MRCPYPKPTTLSDPFQDWEGCEERLLHILSKSDRELTLEDYYAVLATNLPAADYEEGCYYIFTYLDFLADTQELEGRVYEGFFWYVD